MKKVNTIQIKQILGRIDWNFEDYTSLSYPEDINSIHWYPASFVPHIPAVLIQILSEEGEVVLDPFVGSGVTLIEAAKQDRSFIGIDFNPYAIEISKAKFEAINCTDWRWLCSFLDKIKNEELSMSSQEYVQKMGINNEVFRWFHPQTLSELLSIHKCLMESSNFFLLKKVIFSSILKSCCSQKKHYTYISDGCFPKPEDFVRIPAKEKYLTQMELVEKASHLFREQYKRINSKEWVGEKGRILVGDSRKLDSIDDHSVDLVVTSPPYLGCNDYAKSMRLTYLFFPTYDMRDLISKEIGARCKRHKKSLQDEYIKDMILSLNEIKRVLRSQRYLALVFSQGRGRARKLDLVAYITNFIIKKLEFKPIFDTERNILFHRIRFPGVKRERIMVFLKP
jgi:DNA modification methylase